MSKKAFGFSELLILLSLSGMIALLVIRIFSPELPDMTFIYCRVGFFLLGLLFCYFAFDQYVSAKSRDEWFVSRIAAAIRIPLYLSAAAFLFYSAVLESDWI